MSTPCWSNHSRALEAAMSALFWWSADDELDLFAGQDAASIGDRHLDGFGAAGAVDICVQAGHVGDHADFNDVAGNLGLGSERCAHGGCDGDGFEFHFVSVFQEVVFDYFLYVLNTLT
jgi:hypothetical protein